MAGSEHNLGPEVHLLGGVVLDSHSQHPFGLHLLDVAHVFLGPKSSFSACMVGGGVIGDMTHSNRETNISA